MNAVDGSEELARKGQHVRELTLELDLLKTDVDVLALALRLRGMHAERPDETAPSEDGLQEDAAMFESESGVHS